MRVPGQSSDNSKATLKGVDGLNNKLDPMRGGPSSQGVAPRTWQLLTEADNINITDANLMVRRDGYEPFIPGSNITSSFSTFAHDRFYVIDNGTLMQVTPDGELIPLASNLSGPARWAELNDVVFLSVGGDKLCINPDGSVFDWGIPIPFGGRLHQAGGDLEPGLYQVCFTFIDEAGREGGVGQSMPIQVISGGITVTDIPTQQDAYTAIYMTTKGAVFRLAAVVPQNTQSISLTTPVVGRELVTQFFDPPPAAILDIAAFEGRIYGAEYNQDANATVIWFSEPIGYHLFNLNSGFFMVPGRVVVMGAGLESDSLMLSTETRVFLYNRDGLTQVAEYGSIYGQHIDIGSDKKLYFWTKRGLCRASPFENLTESDVSVPPGITASGGVIHQHGYTKFVVALKSGGAAYNKR